MMEEIDRFQVPTVNDNPEMQPLVSNPLQLQFIRSDFQ